MSPQELLLSSIFLGLAVFAVAKFITTSKLIEYQRLWFVNILLESASGGRRGGWREKVAYLVTCQYCTGWWVSAALSAAYGAVVGYGWGLVLVAIASWGVQCAIVDLTAERK